MGQINKILDKNTSVVNNLFTKLEKLATPVEPLQKIDFFLDKKEKMNKTDSVINIKEKVKSTKNKNKLKLRINKSLKYNFSFNIKNNSSIKTCTNSDSKKQNKISFNIKSPLKDKEIHYYKISPNNMKQSKIFVDNNLQEKNLFKKKLNNAKKIIYELEDSKNNNSKNYESNSKTFITQQKIDLGRHTFTHFQKKNLLDKTKLNISNINKLKTQQSFFKYLSRNEMDKQYKYFVEIPKEVEAHTTNNLKLRELIPLSNVNSKIFISPQNISLNEIDIHITSILADDINLYLVKNNNYKLKGWTTENYVFIIYVEDTNLIMNFNSLGNNELFYISKYDYEKMSPNDFSPFKKSLFKRCNGIVQHLEKISIYIFIEKYIN